MNKYDRQMAQLRELIRPPDPHVQKAVFVDVDGTTTGTVDGITKQLTPDEIKAMEAEPRTTVVWFVPAD